MKTETVAPAETLYVSVMFDDFSRTPVKDWQSDWESRKAAKQALKNIALSFEPNKQFKNDDDTNFIIPSDKSSDVINTMMEFSTRWSGIVFDMWMHVPSIEGLRYQFRDGARRHQGFNDDSRGLPFSAWTKSKSVQKFSTTLATATKNKAADEKMEPSNGKRYKMSYVFTVVGEVTIQANSELKARLMFDQWGTRNRLSRGGEWKVAVSGVEEMPVNRVPAADNVNVIEMPVSGEIN